MTVWSLYSALAIGEQCRPVSAKPSGGTTSGPVPRRDMQRGAVFKHRNALDFEIRLKRLQRRQKPANAPNIA